MRVAHITPAFHPTAGGIETLLALLLPELKRKAGVEAAVLVGSPSIWRSEFDHEGIVESDEQGLKIYRFGRLGNTPADQATTHLRVSATVRALLEKCSPEVVHIHGPSRLAYASYRSARALGIPQVLHVHGSVRGQFSPAFIRMCREVDTVIAPSKYVAQSLYSDAGRKAFVHVYFNAIDSSIPLTEIRWGLHSNMLRLIAAGRLEANKGHDIAIHTVRRLLDRGFPASLSVFGEGPEFHALEELAVSLGIRHLITFSNPIVHPQFLSELDKCDFVLVPSRDFEGFGLVAAEAASRAVVCIASDIGGLREVVLHGVSGLLVPENDADAIVQAVVDLVSDLPRFNAMRLAARNHATSNMSLEALASSILNVYTTLIKGT